MLCKKYFVYLLAFCIVRSRIEIIVSMLQFRFYFDVQIVENDKVIIKN